MYRDQTSCVMHRNRECFSGPLPLWEEMVGCTRCCGQVDPVSRRTLRSISVSSWVASDGNVIFIKGGRSFCCYFGTGNETPAIYVLGRFLVRILVGVRMSL